MSVLWAGKDILIPSRQLFRCNDYRNCLSVWADLFTVLLVSGCFTVDKGLSSYFSHLDAVSSGESGQDKYFPAVPDRSLFMVCEAGIISYSLPQRVG